MKTGIELIREEREEQINKHNRTVAWDIATNRQHQLSYVASFLCLPDTGCELPEGFCETYAHDWDQAIFEKMANKEYEERLIIAGALIAAELDRIRECE